MKKIRVYSTWGMEVDLEHEKQVDLWVDNFGASDADIKVLYLCEPEEILNISNQTISKKNSFDFILTHNERVLNECENAVLFEFGGCWINGYQFPEKHFSVSTVVGFKRIAEGHHIRHDLWRKQEEIVIPRKFFISGQGPQGLPNIDNNPKLEGKKDPLFDSMFHIVIENCKRKNWFTEKLIDPLQTKSIPIYWGCPNIGDYFDLSGMFIVSSVDEIIEICNSLTPEIYQKKLKYVEDNFNKSSTFRNLSDRVADKIKELI